MSVLAPLTMRENDTEENNSRALTEAEKKHNVGMMVKYPAEGKAGKDHKKLEKGHASSTEFFDELSFRRLGSGR
ncbi:hypothetical protein KY289_008097 [Solanum tuberosum]|nr:hypothetical protein KY289_008097 [Solanum tuberosum]